MDGLFAMVGRDAKAQASMKIRHIAMLNRFGGDSPRKQRGATRRSYVEDDPDEIELDVGDLLGGATHHDAVAATLRMNRMLARRRIGEGPSPRRRRIPRAPIVMDEGTEAETPLVLDDSEEEEPQSRLRRVGSRAQPPNRDLEMLLSEYRLRRVGQMPRMPGVVDESTEPESPPLVLDDSDDEPRRSREERLLSVHGGRNSLAASSPMLPPTSHKRVGVQIRPYSPPVHVPRRRPRPEDTPLQDGHVGVTRFRDSHVEGHSENECAVCKETVTRTATGDEGGFILGCHHVLHKTCLAGMRRANMHRCPSCRQPIQWNISVMWNSRPRGARGEGAGP